MGCPSIRRLRATHRYSPAGEQDAQELEQARHEVHLGAAV